MIEFLYNYGLFLTKTVTIGIVILLLFIFLANLKKHESNEKGKVKIKNLDDEYRKTALQLKTQTLTAKELKKYIKAENKQLKLAEKEDKQRPRLFVIDFNGDIKASESSGLRKIVSALLTDIKVGDEVLVRLNNSGGMVTEHGLAASQLARIRDQKIPLTVAVDKVAASGGYLMASVAEKIISAPFAILGSIGVVAQIPNFHRLLQRHGVDFEMHTAGEYKRTLTLFGENTDEGREKLKEQLEETHELFKSFVHEYRPQLDLEKVATGEYWYGQKALELGLVDEIQTSDDFLLAARQKYDLYELSYEVRKKPLERLLSGTQSSVDKLLNTLANKVS